MKVMEKIVRENIVTFFTENNLFNPSQHGFMKGSRWQESWPFSDNNTKIL